MKILLILFVAVSLCIAESDTSESAYSRATQKRYSNYLGLAGGYTSGFGISFRKWFTDKWAFQVNFFPWYQENKYPEDDDSYDGNYSSTYRDSGYFNEGFGSLGILLLRSLAEGKYLRFVCYSGTNIFIKYSKYNYTTVTEKWSGNGYTQTKGHESGRDWENTVTIGGGCGPEFYVWRFGFHCMIGLQANYEFTKEVKNVGPSVEGGVHFRY